MDRELRFAIHLDYFMEHFLLIFMKFANKVLIAHRSFKIAMEYCFTLILFRTAKAIYLFTTFFT